MKMELNDDRRLPNVIKLWENERNSKFRSEFLNIREFRHEIFEENFEEN